MQCQINTQITQSTSNCGIKFTVEQITIHDNLHQNNYALFY